MDCFISSDPAAVNATLLYDFNDDKGDLWRRSSLDVPLPPCSSSPSPPDSSCLVCLDQIVRAVCRNLTDGVKMTMEAGIAQVKISKSECPEPPSVDPPQPQFPATMTYILPILILLFLMVGFFIYWKCCRNPKELRGEEIQTHTEEESFVTTDTPVKETEIP